jgi:Flp pilus assembly protein TadG
VSRFSVRLKQYLRRLHHDERGQYLVQFVIIFPIMLILVGLVIDGGLMYWQYRRAEIAVESAAQAASHEIDVDHYRTSNEVVLSPQASVVAHQIAAANTSGQMIVDGVTVAPRQITVHATAHIQTFFFRIFGIASLSMQMQASAYPAFGINGEGQ